MTSHLPLCSPKLIFQLLDGVLKDTVSLQKLPSQDTCYPTPGAFSTHTHPSPATSSISLRDITLSPCLFSFMVTKFKTNQQKPTRGFPSTTDREISKPRTPPKVTLGLGTQGRSWFDLALHPHPNSGLKPVLKARSQRCCGDGRGRIRETMVFLLIKWHISWLLECAPDLKVESVVGKQVFEGEGDF